MQTMAPADGETHEVVDGVYLTNLVAGAQMSIQHYHIESGASVPEHDHIHEQAGVVLRGTLIFERAGEQTTVVRPGETYIIDSEEAHAARNQTDEPVRGIDVFSPPRPSPEWEA